MNPFDSVDKVVVAEDSSSESSSSDDSVDHLLQALVPNSYEQ